MKALYISLLCSKRLLEQLREMSNKNPGYAGQKFDRLMIEGLQDNHICCEALSSIPLNRDMSKKIWWNVKDEIENNISFKYIPFFNIPIIHQLSLFVYSFFYVLFWGIKNRKTDCFIIADVLNFTICAGGMFAAKLLKIKMVGVVTDMPGLMVHEGNWLSRIKVLAQIIKQSIYHYDAYVFLTKYMNQIINRNNVPYIVMEGLVDSKLMVDENVSNDCDEREHKIILYAGGLHVRYGLQTLVEAFIRLKSDNLRLWIYGSGPFVESLKKYIKKDQRIVYKGVVPNNEVVAAEMKSTLLVNPRPTTETFTFYSFPSKNMEYIVSGRPLLTTALPGMPEEYYEYVYLFKEETISGFQSTLEEILSQPDIVLNNKGQNAKQWILKNKNNIIQTQRILDMVKSI